MYTEHFNGGDIRVTFLTKESYWDFLEVANFKATPWAVRIWDKGNYHLASEFPKTHEEYFKVLSKDDKLPFLMV